MAARRQFGTVILACLVGAGLVLLALRQDWAHADYTAPSPLPSGSVSVSGQDLLPAASALALAAVACLAAIIATRGLARRVAAVLMAALGAWIVAVVSQPVHAASVVSAASGAGASAFAGSVPGGNSAISGTTTSSGTPLIGSVTKVVLDSLPWRSAAVAGAALVVLAGLAAAWRGQRWPVMSARFERPAGAAAEVPAAAPGAVPPAQPTAPAPASQQAGEPAAAQGVPRDATHADRDAAALWEALDRGVDLTEPSSEPVAVRDGES